MDGGRRWTPVEARPDVDGFADTGEDENADEHPELEDEESAPLLEAADARGAPRADAADAAAKRARYGRYEGETVASWLRYL